MKVSRKSWHYRLHTLVFTVFNIENYGAIAYYHGKRYYHKPKNLCRYFWSTVTLTAFMPFFLILAGLLLAAFIAIYYGVYWPIERFIYNPYRARHPKITDKEPGLVRSFVAARKARVCPLIQVVD